MLHTWKMLKWASALAVVVTATPASFSQDDIKTVLEEIKKMKEELKLEFKNVKSAFDKIETDLGKLQGKIVSLDVDVTANKFKLDHFEKQMTKLTADLESLKKKFPSDGIALYPPDKALEEIKTDLGFIKQALAKMQTPETRVSKFAPAVGRVVLVNLHQEELLFVVNGREFRLAPNSTMPLEGVAAGTMTYEVISPTWGRRALKSITLSPNETFTLTAQ